MTASRQPRRTSQSPTTPPGDMQWQGHARSYGSSQRNEWLILAFFAALPLATAADIWHQLGWATQSGRLAMLVGLVIALLWAACYFSLKIAVHVRVSATGLSAHQGPWHGEIAWRDMVRLSERTQVADLSRARWIVAEAADGRRLLIPASRVAHYERFVSDANATFTDWRMHAGGSARDGVQLEMPFLASESSPPIGWLLAGGLGAGSVGLTVLAIAHGWSWSGAALLAAGAVVTYTTVRRRMETRSVLLDDRGVAVRSRLGASALAWSAVTGVEQRRGRARLTGAASGLLSGALYHLLAIGRWTDGAPWLRPTPLELVIKGAGRRLRLRLDRIETPDELLAHLEARLRLAAQVRAAAPPVRRVTQRLATVPRPTAPLDPAPTLSAPPDGGAAS